jgi:hypothetical protein
MQSVDPYAAFKQAVLDLAEEVTPTNVRRYLAASRLLARADETGARRLPLPAPAQVRGARPSTAN